MPLIQSCLFHFRNHPLFTLDSSITKLVDQDITITEDLSTFASEILTELETPLGSLMSDVTFPTKYSSSNDYPPHTETDSMDIASGDGSSAVEPDVPPAEAVSLAMITSTIRQQCASITDATYQATSLEACATLSRTLEDALATFYGTLPQGVQQQQQQQQHNEQSVHASYANSLSVQEEVIYDQYY